MRHARAAGVVLAVLVTACAERHASSPLFPVPTVTAEPGDAGADADAPQAAPGCRVRAGRTGALAQQVTVLGKPRRYLLVVPPSYSPGAPYPVVYVLHGHGGSGAQARAAFDLEAVANGRAIFVYPDAPGGWDLDSPAGRNADVALFDASLALTQSAYCVDLERVFVTGFSNGAYMANQLACRRGNRVRAVVSHGGGGPYETAGGYDASGHLVCPYKPVASLVIHGLADGTVAPSEGQKSEDHFAHANGCAKSPSPTSPSPCLAYSGCANPVRSCRIPGLRHALWPEGRKLTFDFFAEQMAR